MWRSAGFSADNRHYRRSNRTLLYYPRLLVHDPLADFFFRDFDALPPTKELHERYGRMTVSASPTTSNGPTEAINGRLEHLRGSALGFCNLTN